MTGQQVATVDDFNDKFSVRHTNKIEPFIPDGFASVLKFAELIAISGMAPKGLEKADKVAVAIFHGLEVGFTPMAALQSIAVINGRPSIWGDGALAMVRASGLLDDIEETYSGGNLWLVPPEFNDAGVQQKPGKPNPEYTGVCTTTRKGAKRPVTHEFSVLDAMTAGLWNKEGPWRTNPKRMLKMRARGFNLRDEFTDVMRGLVLAEEAQDYEVIENPPSERENPPGADENEIAVPVRKVRKPAEKNRHQDAGNGTVEEAEVIEETGDTGAKAAEPGDNEDPPADQEAAKAAAKPKATPKATAREAPKEEPKPKPAADPITAGAAFRDELYKEMDADKDLKKLGPTADLKKYIGMIHDLLAPLNTFDLMKQAWDNHDRMPNLVAAQQSYRNRMRDFHKDRIENIGKDDETPPADNSTGNDQAQQWDYEGFLHALDEMLAAQSEPDGVNKVYAAETAGPIKEGLVSDEQIANGLRPLLATHLERTADFGN
jgi:hypothetical protein